MKYKLTAVSVTTRGVKSVVFVKLPIGNDGKVRMDEKKLRQMFHIWDGETFSFG